MNDHSREITTFTKLFNRLVARKGIRCPSCNSYNVDLNKIDCHETDCAEQHPDDQYYCHTCQWEGTATEMLDRFIDRMNEVPCPCCSGSGFVQQKKKLNFRAAMRFWKINKNKTLLINVKRNNIVANKVQESLKGVAIGNFKYIKDVPVGTKFLIVKENEGYHNIKNGVRTRVSDIQNKKLCFHAGKDNIGIAENPDTLVLVLE